MRLIPHPPEKRADAPSPWQDHDDDLRGGGFDHARLEALLSEGYSQRRTRAL
jgi:hypothetical protein